MNETAMLRALVMAALIGGATDWAEDTIDAARVAADKIMRAAGALDDRSPR